METLYKPRSEDFEQPLRDFLLASENPVCLVGARGQGKTSALYWSKTEINAQANETFLTIVDIRVLRESARFDQGSEFRANLRAALRDCLIREFFPFGRHKLYAWLLAGSGPDDQGLPRALLDELGGDAEAELLRARIPTTLERRERVRRLQVYFSEEAGSLRLADLIQSDIEQRVRPAHVLEAVAERYRRLIVAYDNIDQLDGNEQKECIETIVAIHNSVSRTIGTALSVRRENVREISSATGGGADYLDVVLADGQSYPALALPEPKNEAHISAILRARIDHSGVLESAPTEEESVIPCGVSNDIATRLTDLRVDKLANYSIRKTLQLYHDILPYIQNVERAHGGDLRERRYAATAEGHFETLFFLWLFDYGQLAQFRLHDVLTIDPELEDLSNPPGPSIEHMLMTGVLNEAERSGRGWASLWNVVVKMRRLGFDSEAVGDALAGLAERPNEAAKVLELDDNLKRSADGGWDLAGLRIRLTPSGDQLVRHIYSRIGYVWGRAYLMRTNEGSDIAKARAAYLSKTIAERISILIDYLGKMAEQHAAMLSRLRPSWEREFSNDWLTRYRSDFGVEDKLQVERVLESAQNFYRHRYEWQSRRSPFEKFLEIEATLLEAIASGDDNWRKVLDALTEVRGLIPVDDD